MRKRTNGGSAATYLLVKVFEEPVVSSNSMRQEHAAGTSNVDILDKKLEIVVLPVSDVDRAKRWI